MIIFLIGNNLTSLIVSKILINNGAKIDFLSPKDMKYRLSNRTIGISKSNIDFINSGYGGLKDIFVKKQSVASLKRYLKKNNCNIRI